MRGRELLKLSSGDIFISSEDNFFLLYISQVQFKKKKKTFASYKKIRTFASRLLSHKDKHLIHSELISLCPRWLIRGEAKHLVVTFKKQLRVDTLSYKTISANKATVTKEWVIVDATDQVLGRLGAKVAKLLRGKYKPNFTPHVDCGDNVIIINADKVKLTGNKWNDKVYLSYTGYPGGQREITPARLQAKPNGDDKLLRKVVKGMLPKNKLGAQLLGNMYVYAGSEHKHEAQSPKMIDINALK